MPEVEWLIPDDPAWSTLKHLFLGGESESLPPANLCFDLKPKLLAVEEVEKNSDAAFDNARIASMYALLHQPLARPSSIQTGDNINRSRKPRRLSNGQVEEVVDEDEDILELIHDDAYLNLRECQS